MNIDKDLLDQPMEGRAPGDSFGKEGVPADLTKALAEPALNVELDEERGEALPGGANPLPNRRNGSGPKTVATDSGMMLPGIPRHRNGSFDPIPIAKCRRRLPKVDTKIVSLYAGGMTAREFHGQIEAIHGIEAAPSPISAIARGDGRGDGLAKPVAGAMLSGRLHGRDPGRYSQMSNTAVFGASAILPDGTEDVLKRFEIDLRHGREL